MAKRKSAKVNAESRFGLSVQKRKQENNRILVELFTAPIPTSSYTRDYQFKRIGVPKEELHPFQYLPLDHGKLNPEQVSKGYYVDTFEDTPVVNSILDTLEKRSSIQSSCGKGDWRVHRSRLIQALDLLWG